MRSVTLDAKITCAVIFTALAAGAACNTTSGNNGGYSSTPGTVAPTPGPQPNFTTQAVTADVAPPPISGGTMTIAPDGHTVVASDPDRDRLYVVDIPSRTVKFDIPLAAGAEPGRVAIDSHNTAHIALRGTGSLVSLDLGTGIKTERPLCVAPRGVAFDEAINSLHVACAEGSLLTIPLDGGAVKTLGVDQDVRDIIVQKDHLFVSHFRSAKIKIINRNGDLVGSSNTQGGNLGWRMAKGPNEDSEDVALVSQDPQNPTPTPGGVGYYGSGALDVCNSPTITTTRLDIPGQAPVLIPPAVLPVDLATNGKGEYAIVAAGNGHTPELPQIFIHNVKPTENTSSSGSYSTSGYSSSGYSAYGTNPDCLALGQGRIPGQAIAAVYDADNQLIVQSREPAALYIMSPDRARVYKEIPLSNISREDSGHAIFHSNSGGFLACASCHAEGAEDGRTWEFVEGQRRTPSMRGTLVNTAPYHWDGQMKDIRALVDHVFSTRMSGPKVDDTHVDTLQKWLFRLPAPPKLQKPVDSVARGKQIFSDRGCTTCHSGAEMTNNTTLDVGTGASFQVPSLVGITWRAPYLHNGCAKTLEDRFSAACGGDKHGNIDGLSQPEVKDLTTYLESL